MLTHFYLGTRLWYKRRLLSLGAHAGTATVSNAMAAYIGSTAYDPTAPPVPHSPPTQFFLQLENSTSAVTGHSIPQSGSFYGFSIKFSVINQVRNMTAHNK